jgi:phosphatidylinositol alpha-1,6-mannosyltransferase
VTERRSVLLVLPGAFGAAGGLQMYGRLLIKAFSDLADSGRYSVDVAILNDADAEIDNRYFEPTRTRVCAFNRSKRRFVSSVLRSSSFLKPAVVVFGHVNFASLAYAVRAVNLSADIWFVTYGIDFWKTLPALSRRALRNARRIVAISHYSRWRGASLNGLSESSIDVVPCSLDPFWHGVLEDEPTAPTLPIILTVARLAGDERYKGIDAILSALPSVRRVLPNVRYIIVGDGDDKARLMALARELHVEDCVEFRGRVSAAQLAQAYEECTLFAMPSLSEGFGIVYLEAAAFGKPSIAAKSAGAPEVVTNETGRLIDYNDVNALVAVLTELLSDRRRTHELGLAARERVRSQFMFAQFRNAIEALMPSESNVTL